MKETSSEIEYKDKKYKIVFNLNVMEKIQEEYGTIDKWGELTDTKSKKEINVKALLFGFTEMLNEGIDIENEENNTSIPFFSKKQCGRMLTEIGIQKVGLKINDTVIESVKTEEKNA